MLLFDFLKGFMPFIFIMCTIFIMCAILFLSWFIPTDNEQNKEVVSTTNVTIIFNDELIKVEAEKIYAHDGYITIKSIDGETYMTSWNNVLLEY